MKDQPLHRREPLLVIGALCLFLVGVLVFVGLIWLLKELKITADDVAVGKAVVVALVAIAPGVLGLILVRSRITPVDPKSQKALNPDVIPDMSQHKKSPERPARAETTGQRRRRGGRRARHASH